MTVFQLLLRLFSCMENIAFSVCHLCLIVVIIYPSVLQILYYIPISSTDPYIYPSVVQIKIIIIITSVMLMKDDFNLYNDNYVQVSKR